MNRLPQFGHDHIFFIQSVGMLAFMSAIFHPPNEFLEYATDLFELFLV